MSTSYVIPNVSWQQIIQTAEEIGDMVVTDEGDYYHFRMPIDPQYSIRKRIGLGIATESPPDNIQQGDNTAHIYLYKTLDHDNAWFEGYGVSINHPELILDKLAEAIEMPWYSEHNETYHIYAGREESEEDDDTIP